MRQNVCKDYLKGSRRHHRGHSPFPLDRFLNSRLGRPWDEVYSEMSASFDHRSLSGYSFFSDLRWKIATRCWIGAETGKVYSSEWGGSPVEDQFYVHPFTGVLCWAEPVDRPASHHPETSVDIENVVRGRDGKFISGKAYEKIEGVWYYREAHVIEHEGLTDIRPTYLRAKDVVLVDEVEQYRVKWTEYVSIKRQLSKRELRKNGLHNGGAPVKNRCAVCGFYGQCMHVIKEEAAKRLTRPWRY
jgi:hypothetical protein